MGGRLAGKVALITGGARGQGASHGELFAREGARVVLADVLDDEGTAFAEKLSGEGLDVRYVHLDVSVGSDWEAAVQFAVGEFGSVTILVNNAGISGPEGVAECTPEEWYRILGVNLTGPLLGMQAVIPGMRASGGGSVINIASDWAHTGGAPGRATAYVASKAGLIGLTRNAALGLAGDRIRVNSVSPATVATPMVGELDALHRELVAKTPMRRAARPIGSRTSCCIWRPMRQSTRRVPTSLSTAGFTPSSRHHLHSSRSFRRA